MGGGKKCLTTGHVVSGCSFPSSVGGPYALGEHLAPIPGAGVGVLALCSVFPRTAFQVSARRLTSAWCWWHSQPAVDAELQAHLGSGVPRCLAACLLACQSPSQHMDYWKGAGRSLGPSFCRAQRGSLGSSHVPGTVLS